MPGKKVPGKNNRLVNGILLLDKPSGISSNQALQKVKRLFNARKAGHTGSLDPLATGMLPVCFGEATKVSGFLLDADKRYLAQCRLGIRTDSADSEGNIIRQAAVPSFSRTEIDNVLSQFCGSIQQIPPMHSAIKHHGVRLYKLARQGEEVERKPRQVTVYDIKLLDYQREIIEFDVTCSKGTYIRTLADDIGEVLGCGAHITALRRLHVAPFAEQKMYNLEQLNTMKEQGVSELEQCLLPMEDALSDWPKVCLSQDAVHFICQGQAVFVPNMRHQGYVRLFLPSNQFLGIGTVQDDGRIAPKRLMNMANIG